MDNMNQEHEFNWDDTIEKENSFVLLPTGDYDFTVTNLERKRYTPGPNSKLPACNQAVLDLTIHSPEGDAVIKHNLYLHSRTEGLLSDFFIGIGQKKKDQPLQMNWNTVVGSKGKAHIIVNEYTKNNGESGENNQVKYFIDQRDSMSQNSTPAPTQPTATQQPTAPQAPVTPFPQQPQQNNFTPGAF